MRYLPSMRTFTCLAAWLGVAMLPVLAEPAESVLAAYRERLPVLRAQMPVIVKSAELAAARVVADPARHLLVPLEDKTFCEELLGRAGGLSRLVWRAAPKQPFADGDIALFAVRDWAAEGEALIPKLAAYREGGCLTIVFAPAAGRPEGAVADVFIDNGPAAEAGDPRVNLLANITLGWVWCSEYAAALSRLGKAPGVLRSVAMVDGRPHNQKLQSPEGRQWLGEATEAVAGGVLGERYLERVERLLGDLESEARQAQIKAAVELVAAQRREGKPVYLTGRGHLMTPELRRAELEGGWTVLAPNALEKAASETMAPGDLVLWIGYIGHVGLVSEQQNLPKLFAEKQIRLVLCEAPAPAAERTPADILSLVDWNILQAKQTTDAVVATIDQAWTMPDAEVAIPWAPNWIAPVSGLNAGLILFSLDEAVAGMAAP